MACAVENKDCKATFAALMDSDMGDFFDQWFDETLRFFGNDSAGPVGTYDQPCQHIQSSPPDREEDPRAESLLHGDSKLPDKTNQPVRSTCPGDGPADMFNSALGGMAFLEKGNDDRRSITRSELFNLEGKNASIGTISSYAQQLPCTPPHTPYGDRTTYHNQYHASGRYLYSQPYPASSSQPSLSSSWFSPSNATAQQVHTKLPSPPPSARADLSVRSSLQPRRFKSQPSMMVTAPHDTLSVPPIPAHDPCLSFNNTEYYRGNEANAWLETSPELNIFGDAVWDDVIAPSHFSSALSLNKSFSQLSDPSLSSALDLNDFAPTNVANQQDHFEHEYLQSTHFTHQPGAVSGALPEHPPFPLPPLPRDNGGEISDHEDERTSRSSRRPATAASRSQSRKASRGRPKSQRLRRANKSIRSLAKAAAAAAVAGPGGSPADNSNNSGLDFVNFTAHDSQKILTGVAPSGSSKTKARREREATERRRLLSEAAAKAVIDAGGDIEELRRRGLLEEEAYR